MENKQLLEDDVIFGSKLPQSGRTLTDIDIWCRTAFNNMKVAKS